MPARISRGISLLAPGLAFLLLLGPMPSFAAPDTGGPGGDAAAFPPSLGSYDDAGMESLWDILAHRVETEPFNLWATLIFLGAIVHTFMTHRFRHIAHAIEERNEKRFREGPEPGRDRPAVSPAARLCHFLGEVEAVFGIWVIPLLVLLSLTHGTAVAHDYIEKRVNFTEAVFVVVIMTIASTRPILQLAEKALRLVAGLGGESPVAWWIVLLTVGPLMGSFITEPGAMTICALLLSRKFFALKPGAKLAYGTLGLLFVTISVGGTLTNFAAPPVLMVADAWGWSTMHMTLHFGWKVVLGIAISVACSYLFFRRELHALGKKAVGGGAEQRRAPRIPIWVTIGHLLFMLFTVLNSHHPSYLILGMMFFLAFVEVTQEFQGNFSLRAPVLVGFFLAGLVIHGGLQQWWIAPVLGGLGEIPLMLGAMTLTAFNDNAAITYLCTLVPDFTEGMKYAAVAGAVAGGGLTVIANAPNPAGQSILGKHFEDGISALGLLGGAIAPTLIIAAVFLVFR